MQTARSAETGQRVALPSGPAGPDGIERAVVEGRVVRTAWRLDSGDLSPAEIAAPLRDQLTDAGYEVLFDCAAAACGGFDFRFAVETLDAPQMYVDLSDYRYLLAESEGRLAALMVSRARGAGFVQLTLATPEAAETAPPGPPATPAADGDLWARLVEDGRAVLEDADFAPGSASFEGAAPASLAALSTGLADRPGQRLTIVGHTDADGRLAANVALSTRRAEVVRRALISGYGVDPGRLDAEGVGFLAPRASNATAAGRRANRRVEIVLPE